MVDFVGGFELGGELERVVLERVARGWLALFVAGISGLGSVVMLLVVVVVVDGVVGGAGGFVVGEGARVVLISGCVVVVGEGGWVVGHAAAEVAIFHCHCELMLCSMNWRSWIEGW